MLRIRKPDCGERVYLSVHDCRQLDTNPFAFHHGVITATLIRLVLLEHVSFARIIICPNLAISAHEISARCTVIFYIFLFVKIVQSQNQC